MLRFVAAVISNAQVGRLRSVHFAVAALLLFSLTASAQLRVQPGLSFEVVPGTNAAPRPDPLMQLMLSQPPIDTSEPVALAEFDPPVVAVGQRSTLRVIVTSLADSVDFPDPLPAPAGLRLIPGGSTMQFQPMPGRMQVRSTFNFSVYPQAAGATGIPAFDVTVFGRAVRVPETRLTVVAGEPQRPAVELLFDGLPREVYVGEAVTARLVLPDAGDGMVAAMTQPKVNGESLLLDGGYGRLTRQVITRNGRIEASFASEIQFTPMRPGPLTLVGQASVILGRGTPAQYMALPGYYPLYDTEPAELVVLRVPDEGRPPGYTGAIGQFTVDPPELSANEVRAGEPLRVRVIVRGEGNFKRFTAPAPAPAADWRSYPPEIELGAASQSQRPGFIVFNYVFVPQGRRARATPPVPFAWFDPKTKRFASATFPALPLTVTGTITVASSGSETDGAGRRDDEDEDEPMPQLAGLMDATGSAVKRIEPLQHSAAFWSAQLIPAALLGGLWAWDRRRRHLQAHPQILIRRRAARAARRELRRARAARRCGDERAYVDALTNALREAAAPFIEAEAAALVGHDVRGQWQGGVESDAAVRAQFEARDRMRFSGSGARAEISPRTGAEAEAVARDLIERLRQ